MCSKSAPLFTDLVVCVCLMRLIQTLWNESNIIQCQYRWAVWRGITWNFTCKLKNIYHLNTVVFYLTLLKAWISSFEVTHFTLLVIILLVFVLIETNLSSHSNVCLLRCKLLVVVKTWNSSGLYMGWNWHTTAHLMRIYIIWADSALLLICNH